MWCVADLDADYIARMEDVLALYEKPYTEKEPVVCLDEKPVSLHAEVRPRARAISPNAIASTNAVGRPISSRSSSPKRAGISPARPPTGRRHNSLEWFNAW